MESVAVDRRLVPHAGFCRIQIHFGSQAANVSGNLCNRDPCANINYLVAS